MGNVTYADFYLYEIINYFKLIYPQEYSKFPNFEAFL